MNANPANLSYHEHVFDKPCDAYRKVRHSISLAVWVVTVNTPMANLPAGRCFYVAASSRDIAIGRVALKYQLMQAAIHDSKASTPTAE